MHKHHSSYAAAYKRALELYVRKGIHVDVEALEMELKAENEPPKESREQHSTPYYIWRTQGDSKVRSRHAEQNGKIFSWDNPPEGGHPGEDYNCRCWAEAITSKGVANQTLVTNINGTMKRWSDYDLVAHAYFGNGKPLTLSQIGHLKEVINHYAYFEKGVGVYGRIKDQIINEAKVQGEGNFSYRFSGSYDFDPVSFVHGNSVVKGTFTGNARKENGLIFISGQISYEYSDIFTDPLSIREKYLVGTSDPDAVRQWQRLATDGLSSAFKITGQWDTLFTAVYMADEE